MATEILSAGYHAFKDANSSATTAKSFILANGMILLPLNDAAADAENVFVYEASKVRVPKAAGAAWAPGDYVYWDVADGEFNKSATGNTLAGFVVEDALSAATEGVIHLRPYLPAAA